MAYKDFKVAFGIGEITDYDLFGTLFTASPSNLTSTGMVDAGLFSAEKYGVITDVGFFVADFLGTGSYVASIVTVGLDKVPTNIDYGGSSGVTFLSNEVEYGWNWKTLSQPATGTAGDIIAVRVKSLSSDASNYISVPDEGENLTTDSYLPNRYASYLTATNGRPIYAYRYNDGHVHGYPVYSGYSINYNSGSSRNYWGMKFSVPFDAKCNGIRLTESVFNVNSAGTIILYDDANNVLVSEQVSHSTPSFGKGAEIMFDETELGANNTYRLVLRSDKNANCVAKGVTFSTGTYRYTLPNGEYCMTTYRTGTTGYTFGSAWVDDEFSAPYIALLINKVDDGAGTPGGGGNTGTSNYYGWAS